MTAGLVATACLLQLGLLLPPAVSQQISTKPVITPSPVQAPAAPDAPVSQKGTLDPDYKIGPGDSLDVNVFNEPKFSGRLPVRPDGMITVSLVGDVLASGYTPMQLGAEITSRLRKLITDPSVTVTVLDINSKRIYLVGEVAKVGPMAMTPGMNPMQAIATAGGLSPYANAKKIYILRSSAGKQEKIPFNYKKAIKSGDLQGVTLANGDTIVVP